MKVLILTKTSKVYENLEVDCISLNTSSGYISIYPDHTNMITKIDEGLIEIEFQNDVLKFYAEDGLVMIENDNITILVSDAINIDNMDEGTLTVAYNEIIEKLQQKDSTVDQDENYSTELETILRRLDVKLDLCRLKK